MPQINEFSWLFVAAKLMVIIVISLMLLNHSNTFYFPKISSSKMNFFKSML